MNETQFWAIIESGGPEVRAEPEPQLVAVRTALQGIAPAEVAAFHRWFNQKLAEAYSWDLWGAAYLINGGCSDDGFAYFRAWLIAQGESIYQAACANPDTLASLVDPERDDYEFEELWGIAGEVYEGLTGESLPLQPFAWPTEPAGARWDFDDAAACAHRLPQLAALYDG